MQGSFWVLHTATTGQNISHILKQNPRFQLFQGSQQPLLESHCSLVEFQVVPPVADKLVRRVGRGSVAPCGSNAIKLPSTRRVDMGKKLHKKSDIHTPHSPARDAQK